jgi:hypothetical protein
VLRAPNSAVSYQYAVSVNAGCLVMTARGSTLTVGPHVKFTSQRGVRMEIFPSMQLGWLHGGHFLPFLLMTTERLVMSLPNKV